MLFDYACRGEMRILRLDGGSEKTRYFAVLDRAVAVAGETGARETDAGWEMGVADGTSRWLRVFDLADQPVECSPQLIIGQSLIQVGEF